MKLKCVICHHVFNSKAHSDELKEMLRSMVSTFCSQLVPNSNTNTNRHLQFCSSCRPVFLKQVREGQSKIFQLSARMKQTVFNLKRLVVQNHTELFKKPIIALHDHATVASKLQAGPEIAAEMFVGDSVGNTIHFDSNEERRPLLPVTNWGELKNRCCGSGPPCSLQPTYSTDMENEVSELRANAVTEHSVVAQTNKAVPSDPVENQTNEVILSSSLSQTPADCLAWRGIPYEKLPYGKGYRCWACKSSKAKRSLHTIKKHIRHIHLGQPRPTPKNSCVLEDVETQRIRYLGKYICHKLPDGSFKCGSCDYATKRKFISSVLAHIRLKHEAPLFVRRLVEVSPDKFEYHGLTAERRKDGSYLCGSCHFNTKSMNRLRNHLWEKRKTGIPRTCKVCDKVFQTNQSFYQHRQTHPNGEEQNCAQCGKSFDTKSKLKRHIENVHRRPARPTKPSKIYVCDFCGKQYKAKYNFDSHMNMYHSSNRKTFECKVCGKGYASYMARRVHMNSHTGKTVHSCDICDMKFTQAYSVVRHKNVAHKES